MLCTSCDCSACSVVLELVVSNRKGNAAKGRAR